MERLPYIDKHERDVPATPEDVWPGLTSVLRGMTAEPPAAFVRAWALNPAKRRGAWSREGTPAPGDALPGFRVVEVERPHRVALAGRHRFSRYSLTFELQEVGGGTRISAETRAEFPGLLGWGYRQAVIGSGGHRLVVRRMLRLIAGRA